MQRMDRYKAVLPTFRRLVVMYPCYTSVAELAVRA
jgi:hypothetical protein